MKTEDFPEGTSEPSLSVWHETFMSRPWDFISLKSCVFISAQSVTGRILHWPATPLDEGPVNLTSLTPCKWHSVNSISFHVLESIKCKWAIKTYFRTHLTLWIMTIKDSLFSPVKQMHQKAISKVIFKCNECFLLRGKGSLWILQDSYYIILLI